MFAKNLITTSVLLVGAFSLSSCKANRGAQNGVAGAIDTTGTSSKSANGRADTTPVAQPPESTTTAMGDPELLAKAIAGDSAEIAIARLVRLSTKNAAVKSYASMLERDHGKGMSTVDKTAKSLGVTMRLPASDTTSQETAHTMDHLKSLSGTDRDTAFVNHEIVDHEHDIADAKQMEAQAKAPAVQQLFKNEMPELDKHLNAAKNLSSKLSGAKP